MANLDFTGVLCTEEERLEAVAMLDRAGQLEGMQKDVGYRMASGWIRGLAKRYGLTGTLFTISDKCEFVRIGK